VAVVGAPFARAVRPNSVIVTSMVSSASAPPQVQPEGGQRAAEFIQQACQLSFTSPFVYTDVGQKYRPNAGQGNEQEERSRY